MTAEFALQLRTCNSAEEYLVVQIFLKRTHKAFGYKNIIYTNANTFEFCSAKLSHLLARANPKNITVCPFTISVYELTNDLGKTHIAYQKPIAEPGSDKTLTLIVELIEGIIEDASW